MAYKDKYGITDITPQEDKVDVLSINWDYNDNADDVSQRYPVLFYTPYMEDLDKYGCPEHYHIRLNRKKAEILRDWLNDYLADTELYNKE